MEDEDLLKALKTHLTPGRVARIEAVAAERTRKITLVLEDISQEHNIGALLRTADIMGVQDVHLISQQYEARLAKAIAKGSTKWISLHRYQGKGQDNFQLCLKTLRSKGYQLAVADPDGDISLDQLEYQGQALAVLMGTEWEGTSKQAIAEADYRVRIPQFGFTQSFNVSVAAALFLQQLCTSMRNSEFPWRLDSPDRLALELDWVMTRLGPSAWPLRRKIEADWNKKQV